MENDPNRIPENDPNRIPNEPQPFPANAPRPKAAVSKFVFNSGYATGIHYGGKSSPMARLKPLKPNILDRQADIRQAELSKQRADGKWKVVREFP